MNVSTRTAGRIRHSVAWLTGLAASVAALAFPPAPHHVVYGLVRDEQGTPLNNLNAEVLLEANGVVLRRTTITTGPEPGVNYRMTIPMDSGATPDLYQPTALLPTVPFRMRVKIGNVSYLPIEMTGAAHLLTRPGESSRVDLTLGEDLDGDGIPDAWERTLNAALGGNRTIGEIRPEDDDDGDGLTNLQEYLAGTYAFDPADGYALTIRSLEAGRPHLEFTAIRGRSYTLLGSSDLQTWSPVTFTVPAEGASGAVRGIYRATDVRLMRVLAGPFAEGEVVPAFFKVMVQ